MGDKYYNIANGKSPNYPSSSTTVNAADTEEEEEAEEHEHMFEKVVTPSDVGKLNRLVIPKQHAERYFPLDPASNEKGGLLLSFEEERSSTGTDRPTWHFRYSYWNSSQSYVITKGWSRFVKDKRLDSGDTVSFSRAPATGRLFIGWRRRPSPPLLLRSLVVPTWGWGGLFLPPPPPLPTTTYYRPVGPTLAPPKRVRLFGVNLDCSSGQEQAEKYILPPSPLQWRLSPVPSPIGDEIPQLEPMDQDGRINEKGSF